MIFMIGTDRLGKEHSWQLISRNYEACLSFSGPVICAALGGAGAAMRFLSQVQSGYTSYRI